MSARPLRAVPDIEQAQQDELQVLHEQLAGAERELRAWRSRWAKLTADRQADRDNYENKDLVRRLFDFWRERTGHERAKLTPDRFDAIRGALELGFSAREVAFAIAGIAFDPYVTTNRNGSIDRHDDLLIALKDAKHVEMYGRKRPK